MATVGRKPRKSKYRSRGRGSTTIKAHTRSPRGPNRGKSKVRVRPHRRNNPAGRKRKR